MNQRQNQHNFDAIHDLGENTMNRIHTRTNPVKTHKSYVNQELQYSSREKNEEMCDYDGSAAGSICILSFTQCCDTDHPILIGGYCLYHNLLLFKRVYLAMPFNSGIRVVPFSQHRALYQRSMFLTSLLPINASQHDIEALLQHVGSLSNEERNQITKFYSFLSQIPSRFKTDRDTAIFKVYMQEILAGYSRWLNLYDNVISNLQVSVTLDDAFANTLKNNKFFEDIQKHKVAIPNETVEIQSTYEVPLSLFNIIDILSILSYHLDVRINQVGYAANCEIGNGAFIHGSGQGILNAIDQYNQTSIDAKFREHAPEVRDALEKEDLKTVANLDVMVLSVTAINTSNAPQDVRLSVLVKSTPNNRPDMSLITLKPIADEDLL